MSETFKTVFHRNPNSPLPEAVLDKIAKQREQETERMRKIHELNKLAAATRDEEAVRKAFTEMRFRQAGIDQAQAAAIQADRDRRYSQIISEWGNISPPSVAPMPLPDRGPVLSDGGATNQMWWAESHGDTNDNGLTVYWDDTNGFSFAGEATDPAHHYKQTSVNLTATFVLTGDRMSPDIIGADLISAPTANLIGAIRAAALANILSIGSQYAKCTLKTTQVVSEEMGLIGSSVAVNQASVELISVQNAQADFNYFPGMYPMPQCRFKIDAGWSIKCQLYFSFVIEMDGDNSIVTFGKDPIYQANNVQTPQWYITRA